MRVFLLALLLIFAAVPASARMAYTPRDSGTEPPGGPRAPEGMPTPGNFGRTPEGGMGYTDAYGNTITDRVPEEKKHERLRSGAYGGQKKPDPYSRPLPEPKASSRPKWSF